MKEQFADYETAKMLKELGMNEKCFACYNSAKTFILFDEDDCGYTHKNTELHSNNQFMTAPLWQQIEVWLWGMHFMWIEMEMRTESPKMEGGEEFKFEVTCLSSTGAFFGKRFDSPITAKIEGIKAAVKYLYQQHKTKTS